MTRKDKTPLATATPARPASQPPMAYPTSGGRWQRQPDGTLAPIDPAPQPSTAAPVQP